jgi:hypothetical protein
VLQDVPSLPAAARAHLPTWARVASTAFGTNGTTGPTKRSFTCPPLPAELKEKKEKSTNERAVYVQYVQPKSAAAYCYTPLDRGAEDRRAPPSNRPAARGHAPPRPYVTVHAPARRPQPPTHSGIGFLCWWFMWSKQPRRHPRYRCVSRRPAGGGFDPKRKRPGTRFIFGAFRGGTQLAGGRPGRWPCFYWSEVWCKSAPRRLLVWPTHTHVCQPARLPATSNPAQVRVETWRHLRRRIVRSHRPALSLRHCVWITLPSSDKEMFDLAVHACLISARENYY